MSNTAAKTRRITSPLLDRRARLAARKRVIGLWKNQYREMAKENKKVRKEWDTRVKKLGW
ncbi:hypothetical protein A3A38_04540 [Candidatus Kaiserbacteria bacterium RIFCSPLOWO2_01_FULL_53_17]|uniref:Uncharacterized protein n=1 Tax=Candidatus Kaiserbacteria bacterium RIFCSPLOWO2_01_FULL_53_17 TaxID=1798511 RepID=A0A1F6EH58_9BACT|nr:MAG: hypothetical protein A3A38_04540 [Candidatus Kaiserbacteria bacterium RIFCSPLOWO2_01_FULL_53_17]